MKQEEIIHSTSPTIEERRNLRFSSNPQENNVKSLERLLFRNLYMHQSYKPQLDHNQSFEYAKHILNEQKSKMKESDHQKSVKFFKDLEPLPDPSQQEDQEQQGVVKARKIKFNSRNRESDPVVRTSTDIDLRRQQRFKNSLKNNSKEQKSECKEPTILSQFETYLKTDIGSIRFQKKPKQKESPKGENQKLLAKLEPDPLKLHKEKVQSVVDDFMKVKFRVVNNSSIIDLHDRKKSGGLVSVSKIIEEIKEKEDKAKEEQRGRMPQQNQKQIISEPKVKLSFFEKLKQKKAEASKILTESQSKFETLNNPSHETSIIQLSLFKPKIKPIPPLYSEDQKIFFAKLQSKLNEHKKRRSQTKLADISRSSLATVDYNTMSIPITIDQQNLSSFHNQRYSSTLHQDEKQDIQYISNQDLDNQKRKSYVQMFDDPLERDPQNLTFEETFENLDLLNRRMVQKLNDAGLDQEFNIKSHSMMKRSSVSTLKYENTSIYNEEYHPILLSNIKNQQIESLTVSKKSLPSVKSQTRGSYPKLTQSRISHLLQVCSQSRQQVMQDVRETESLEKIQDYHTNIKEAFARYDDGKPFFRDLKVLEIMEDMEILQDIDNQLNAERINLPPLITNKKKSPGNNLN